MERFTYHKPKTSQAIVELLVESRGNARLLAGGTDLLVQLRSRMVRPPLLIDLKGVEELQELSAGPEGLSIGAAVILNRLLEEREVHRRYGALAQAVADLASYTIRNRATLVGNVTNASPCADSVPPLCVMEGQAEILGPSGTRALSVKELITGVRETGLQPDEFVTRIVIPRPQEGTWSAFTKRKRVKGHDLALANAALLRDPERRILRLSIGSCNPVPVLIELDEMFDQPDSSEAARRATVGVNPIDDVRASQEYRREMVGLMVRRLFSGLDARGRE